MQRRSWKVPFRIRREFFLLGITSLAAQEKNFPGGKVPRTKTTKRNGKKIRFTHIVEAGERKILGGGDTGD